MKRILCALFLFSRLSAAGLDLDSAVRAVRVFTGDQLISGIDPRYSTSTIIDMLNIAQYEIVDLTWCLTYETAETISANTTYYTMPDNTFAPYRVLFGTTTLEVAHINELDRQYPAWQNDSASWPEKYSIKTATYSAASPAIMLYPVPNTSGTLTINSVLIPTELSAGTDVPFNGDKRLIPYHGLMVLRVASLINDVRGFENLAARLDSQYAALLASMLNTIRIKPGEIPKKDQRSP